MAPMKKRVLALVMALAMIATLFPLAAFALDPAPTSQIQIEGENTPLYYGGKDGPTTDSKVVNNTVDPRVTMKKTIAGTGAENVFNITLDVTTNQKVVQTASMPDAAVALVIDTSGSMDYCAQCGKDKTHAEGCQYFKAVQNGNKVLSSQAKNNECKDCEEGVGKHHRTNCEYYDHANDTTTAQSRMAMAKEAAIAFAESFAASGKVEGQTEPASRFISLVTFAGGDKNEYSDSATQLITLNGKSQIWVDVTNEAALAAFKETVNSNKIKANGWTNVTAGLQRGSENLDTLFVAQKDNKELTRGTSYLLLLGDGEPNHTVYPPPAGFPQGGNAPFEHAKRWAKNIAATGTTVMTAYAGVDANDEGYKWFQSFSKCKLASNVEELVDAFELAITLLRLNSKAWLVTDPMGANIGFEKVISENNNTRVEDNKLIWDLHTDLPEVLNADGLPATGAKPGDPTTWPNSFQLHYSMTYQVKLDSTGNNAASYNLTNGDTVLDYYLTNMLKKENSQELEEVYVDDNGNKLNWKDETLLEDVILHKSFKTPKVKALGADLQFNKVSAYDATEKLQGAKFSAKLTDTDRVIIEESTSNEQGLVSMNSLPSGQNYTIVETKSADDAIWDKDSAETMTLAVEWGEVKEVTLTGKNSIGKETTTTIKDTPTLTNKKLLDNTGEFPVTKIWNDGGDKTGRPAKITISLDQYKGNDLIKEDFQTFDLKGDTFKWTHTFKDLPVKDVNDDQLYTYKAVEKNVPDGYTKSGDATEEGQNGSIIMNTSTSIDNKKTIEGNKKWIDDADAKDVVHPTVTMKLMKPASNGKEGQVEVGSFELKNGETHYKFVDVPAYEYGQEIQYTVVEVVGKDYDDKYNAESVGNNFTNRIKQGEKSNIPVTVTWVDGDNAMISRPDGVTLKLYADDAEVTDAQISEPTKNEETGTWSYSFTPAEGKEFSVYQTDADNKVTGKKVVYSVKQDGVPTPLDGDKVGADDYYDTATNENDPLNVINTLKGETTQRGDKTWIVPDGIEKPDISFKLMKGDNVVQENVTLDSENKFEFTPVDKYDANGALITYSVQEMIGIMDNGSFAQTSVQDADGTWHFTNTYSEMKTIHVEKIWKDNNDALKHRPGSIQVQLYADGVAVRDPMTLNAANNWNDSFKDLEKYKTVEVETPKVEEPVEIEQPELSPAPPVNTVTPPTEEPSETPTEEPSETPTEEPGETPSEEPGEEPSETPSEEPGEEPGETPNDNGAVNVSEISATGTNNTGATLDETPAPTLTTDSVLISYTIEEISKDDWSYEVAYASDSEEEPLNFTITNTLTSTEKVTVSGTKTWEDMGGIYNTRPNPETVTFQLYRNNVKQDATTTLNEAGTGYEFTNLDKLDENGAKYTYTVQEIPLGDLYTSKADENNLLNFTNTLNQRTTTLEVKKVWMDGDLDKHPDVKFYLYCNGELFIDLTSPNPYTLKSSVGEDTFTFVDLPEFKMENGKVVGKNVYTIKEGPANTNEPGAIEDYQEAEINYDGSPIVVTNKLIGVGAGTPFTFTKMWLAPDEAVTTALPNTEFTIYRNGVSYGEHITGDRMILDTETGLYVYHGTKEDFPNYSEDGSLKFNYTVAETKVPDGFTLRETTQETTNFVNTINPGVAELKGQKTWKLPEGMTRENYNITIEVYQSTDPAKPGALLGTKEITSATEKDFVFTITDVIDAAGALVTLPQYSAAGDEYVYTIKEVSVPAGYTYTSSVDEATGTHFINTIQEAPYQVIAHYTATVDGKTVVDNKQVTLVDDKRFGADLTVTFAPENHLIDGDYSYTHQSATLEQDGKTINLTSNSATLTTSGDKHIIHLYFTYHYSENPSIPVVLHNMTVNYYHYAGRNSDSPIKVMASHNESTENGLPYNVSAWTSIPLAGYQLLEVSGDAIAGTMTADKTVNVWYNSTDNGDNGGGGGFGGPDETTPPTTGGSTTPPTTEILDPETPLADRPLTELPLISLPDQYVPLSEIPEADVPLAEIPDEDVPLAEIPDKDVPLAEIPDEDVPLAEIPDGNVPLGDTPKTGDESAMGLWITLMILSGLGLSALAIFGKGKRGTDADNK